MKISQLITLALLTTTTAIGQISQDKISTAEHKEPSTLDKPSSSNKTGIPKAGVIWSEDFANGFPSGWTATPANGDCPWVYTTDGSWGNFSNGGTTAAGTSIASTSAGNGFLISDPDSANHFMFGQPSGTNYQYLDSYFQTDAIDLTGYPAVVLEFEQFFRFNNSPDMFVSISTDNSTWTDFDVKGTAQANTVSVNAETVRLNISSVAGGASTVYIKIGWSARVYFWQIDDIRIVEADDNDLAMNQVYYNTVNDSTELLYYRQLPSRQAKHDTLKFGARVTNLGAADQPNTSVTVNITGPLAYSGVSVPMTFPLGGTDSMDVSPNFLIPPGLGTYSIDFNVMSDSTDSFTDNNTWSSGFEVTDTVYARDNNDMYSGGGYWFGAGDLYQIANSYMIYEQDTATSISVYMPTGTAENSVVSFHLYDESLSTPIASNQYHVVTAQELGTWITLPLPETALVPGEYLAAMETFTDTVNFSISSTAVTASPLTSFVNNSGTWYYSSRVYYVRLNVKADPCLNLTTTGAVTNISCNGNADGAIDLSVNGGSGNLTYNWSNGSATANVSGLGSGQYLVTVSDVAGCYAIVGFDVTEPTILTETTSSTDETCGAEDGSASISVNGGTGSYTYLWNDGQATATASNLGMGTYTVTATDVNGCTIGAVLNVAGTPSVTLSSSNIEATCGVADGSATVAITQGSTPYTYLWSTGNTADSVTGLGAGVYTVTVIDGLGCNAIETVMLNNVGAPVLSTTVTDLLCNNDNSGLVVLSTDNANGPYTYMWSNGVTTATLSGIAAGYYAITVLDGQGTPCMALTNVWVTEPSALSSTANATNASCAGINNGSVSVTATGGTTDYSYLWDNGNTGAAILNLSNGTYNVTVTDANGCSTLDGDVVNNNVISGSVSSSDILCNGETNGQISSSVNGSAPYSYVWDDGQLTAIATGLAEGTYTVTMTDANGCTVISSATIQEPEVLTGTTSATNDQGGGDGTVTVNLNGGTPAYNYSWSNGQNGQMASSLAPGTFTCTVTDANGCSVVVSDVVLVGLEELIDAANVTIFPNPTNESVNVIVRNVDHKVNIQLTDPIGKLIFSESSTGSGSVQSHFDVSALAKGVYFIHINTNKGNITSKIIIE